MKPLTCLVKGHTWTPPIKNSVGAPTCDVCGVFICSAGTCVEEVKEDRRCCREHTYDDSYEVVNDDNGW